MKFDSGRIISSSISSDNNVIAFLDLPDTVLKNESEELEFNFADIFSNLRPYVDLVKDEEVDLKLEDSRMIIKDSEKKKFELFFCTKEFTNRFSGTDKSDSFDYFYENQLSSSIIAKFDEIKKIALKFGKIYFICEDGKLYIEATDKTNSFCNSLKLEIDDIDSDLDISMCFDFKNLKHILNTVGDNIDDFKLKCTYIKDSEAGMVLFENTDKTEKYFITSKSE